jgi:hypothetical protein
MGGEVSGLLDRVAQLLEAAGIPFMVAGSFASTAHGLPRSTQDLDLVIDPPDAAALEAMLASIPADRYYVDADAARDALRRRSMFNMIDLASGWKVDLIVRKNRAFSRDEFAQRMKMSVLGVPVFVASPEDTIHARSRPHRAVGSRPGLGRRVGGREDDRDLIAPASSRPDGGRDASAEVGAAARSQSESALQMRAYSPFPNRCPTPCHFTSPTVTSRRRDRIRDAREIPHSRVRHRPLSKDAANPASPTTSRHLASPDVS